MNDIPLKEFLTEKVTHERELRELQVKETAMAVVEAKKLVDGRASQLDNIENRLRAVENRLMLIGGGLLVIQALMYFIKK